MSVIGFSPIIRLLVCVCWRNRRKKNNCTQEPWNKAHFCHSSVANPMDDINFFVVAALLVCGYTSSLDKKKTPRNIICQTREYSRRIPIHRMIHSQVKTSVFFSLSRCFSTCVFAFAYLVFDYKSFRKGSKQMAKQSIASKSQHFN